MKRLLFASAVIVLSTATVAQAQRPVAGPTELQFRSSVSPGIVTPTPEMWFYEQELRRYEDPKVALRRRAELRAQQRDHRIAAREWYGLSKSRPQAGVDPFHGTYLPGWTSNDSLDPFRWHQTTPLMVLRPGRSTSTY